MGDLINRKSLMQKLKEYVETVYECDFDDPQCTENGGSLNPKFVQGLWEAKEIIGDIPVAYDVDKVIEQLKGIKQSIIPLTGMDNYYVGQLILINEIIPIVKRGGKDE